MISIIVPVFHTQKTLRKCFNSICNQNYPFFELIIVIDGTDDIQVKCLDYCKSYQLKDERITIIVQENAGVDRARFAGLKAAKGEFVTFVDADDWLEPNALSSIIEIMNEDDYDVVLFSSFKCLGPIKKRRNLPKSGPISTPELFDKYYMSFFGWNILPVSIWGKLYRRETLEKSSLTPSGFAMGEDLIFNMSLFPYLNKIFLLNKPYYNYRFGGMTSRYNPHLLKDLKAQFVLKLLAIDKYSYHQADNPARIEMVNVLHSDIIQRIIYFNNSKESIVESISKEISDCFWKDVLNITTDYLDSSPFYIALKNYDAEAIYNVCKDEVDGTSIQRFVKRIGSGIIKLF